MAVARMTQKGQILIPKMIRNKYGIKPGLKLQIIEEKDALIIKPAPENPTEAACGFLRGNYSLTDDLIEEHKKGK
ncbi:MAG: AbrB/MazE/SpoVT family DNA-binding domain-containing protein [Deltaproteobacteria bacterium]|nr:AbrB/MazE/SpoVT family DNA-binding domain-containing protein [Deltaproteobacteria bacterium]